MICGKGAAAACAIVLNEEQFEACCGGIRARYQRQSQQPLLHGTNPLDLSTVQYTKNSKVQEILLLVPLIHW